MIKHNDDYIENIFKPNYYELYYGSFCHDVDFLLLRAFNQSFYCICKYYLSVNHVYIFGKLITMPIKNKNLSCGGLFTSELSKINLS